MKEASELIIEIQKLERLSKRLLPVTLIGLLLIIGGIIFSSIKLQRIQSSIEEKEELLEIAEEQLQKSKQLSQDRLEAVKNAESQLNELEKEITELTDRLAILKKQSSDPKTNISISAALATATEIDRSITTTGAELSASTPSTVESIYGTTRVDLFYCESVANTKRLAEKALQMSVVAPERWRIRKLTTAVNSQAGYRLTANLIRYNADEETIAKQLQQDLKNQLGLDFSLQLLTSYPSPNYVSAFFCKA